MEYDLEWMQALDHAHKLALEVYEKYRYKLMTNPEMPIYFELGEYCTYHNILNHDTDFYLCGVHCAGCIVLCLYPILQSAIHMANHTQVETDDEYLKILDWCVILSVLHEMAHNGQRMYLLNTDLCTEYFAVVKETNADYIASKICMEDFGCPEYIIDKYITDGYARGMMHDIRDNARTDYWWYYYEFIKTLFCFTRGYMTNKQFEALQSVMDLDDVTIINKVNGNNIIIPVKVNGVILPPGKDMCDLYSILFLGCNEPQFKDKIYDIQLEFKYETENDATFILTGNRLVPGFTTNMAVFYNCL